MSNVEQDTGGTVTMVANTAALGLVDATRTTDLNGIRVFDVGQGDCIGLLDQLSDVFCYVDYGGLAGHPDQLSPANTAKRLPVHVNGHDVPIVLTHWDKDHYYSAVKKNTAAQSCEWLVPRQLASPFAILFAAKLTNAKCWPEAHGNAVVGTRIGKSKELQIRKCLPFDPTATSENRNLSGLAVTLVETGSEQRVMVLPGDCHFDGIPNMPGGSIHVVVAYHHGSATGWTSATGAVIAKATSTRRLAYSYGPNPYGHPQHSNYKPIWDASAVETPTFRPGREYEDLVW